MRRLRRGASASSRAWCKAWINFIIENHGFRALSRVHNVHVSSWLLRRLGPDLAAFGFASLFIDYTVLLFYTHCSCINYNFAARARRIRQRFDAYRIGRSRTQYTSVCAVQRAEYRSAAMIEMSGTCDMCQILVLKHQLSMCHVERCRRKVMPRAAAELRSRSSEGWQASGLPSGSDSTRR